MSTIAFTGHRHLPDEDLVRDNLRTLLSREKGFSQRRGITGGALGADTIAAEVMCELGIPYQVYAPCFNQDARWNDEQKENYQTILERAEEVRYIYADDYPGPKVMWDRNEAMVDDCQFLVGIYDGTASGGTASTVRYAKEVNRTTILLHPSTRYILPKE